MSSLKLQQEGGSSSGPISGENLPISKKDPDSVFDTVQWDYKNHGSSKDKVWGSSYTHHSSKLIAVESCPDGTIVFHYNGLFGATNTTIKLTRWRNKNKEEIFDKVLEKAYKNPLYQRYSIWHKPVHLGAG